MEVLKELTESINEKTGVSRRGFLKGLGALSATAAIYGCGGGENLASYKTEPSVTPQDNLVLDKELKVVMASHPFNCGGRCLFKLHVKNGRMLKITGAVSDIPRAGSTEADESIDKPQLRACIRGYGQIKRNYQPDRLKYPMKQTGQRGDYRGFKRISWDEAFDTIAGWYKETIARKDKLGYIPATGGVFSYFGTYVGPAGAPSYENFQQAKYGAIGQVVQSNAMADLLNSKFILNIGCNTTTSFSHQFPNHWYFTKAKEAGIPIVTMDPWCTDTASPLSTGYSKYNLPAYINPRMGSDSAILAAMANVIYRKGLHDEAFIKQYCFGFYKGDTVVSQSTKKHPITGAAYAGQTFVTPTGMSFVEYLDELQTKHGGYSGVLNWASQVSGVPAKTIENLGIAYGETKPSCLYGGWGAMRSTAAYHHSWMLIALAAMTGQANKKGGGPGFAMSADPTPVTLGATKEPITTAKGFGTIYCSANALPKVILTGTDHRTYAQLRADALALNKIDLGEWKAQRDDVNGKDGRLRVEMMAWSSNYFNNKPAINKLRLALSKVKHTYQMDHFMTPTIAHSDIVLPQKTHLERNEYQSKSLVYYFNNKVVEPMFECMDAIDINAEILKRLGINYGKYGPRGAKTDRDLMAEQWAGAKINATLLTANPDAKLPSFEDFSQTGVFQLPLPADKAPLGLASYQAGKFPTDTGRINFFSPFYFNRDKSLGDAYKKPDGGYYRSTYPPKAQFAPPFEGYDPVTGEFKGYYEGHKVKAGQKVRYTLQIDTAHHRRRAHTVYDNVAVLKENFPGVVTMNTADAAARGINDGDEAYAFNDWGCVKQKVTVTRRLSKGTIHIGDGEWYRASTTETYEAWLDIDGDGVPEKNVVPVDVGGAPNTLMNDRDVGIKEGFYGDSCCGLSSDNSWNGHFLEVSKTHPDK